ncbi:MAG: phosphoribosyl transferase [Gammaproteobacteria bacterium RIFCSPHIGHO2_12_FULL_43_28]|nr:MAG: phosphoribosyl transferase [Gammaproteobacteria bacterium RIFCSPHIGHO2_12_FULL_43_28]
MIQNYSNREEAGKILAKLLHSYAGQKDALVLALPRGGVPVAYEIAKALHLPLDVFIVRKLGVPGHSELAMGAIAMGGATVFNDDIVHELQISQTEINRVIATEEQELLRRQAVYRGDKPFPPLRGKTIILVDDGVATGATIRSAILSLKKVQPATLIVAVPVADRSICKILQPLVDEFYCPLQPDQLYAVGAWYEDFSQTEDEEVFSLLRKAEKFKAVH